MKFDEMVCNDPLFNINYMLQDIDGIVYLEDDRIDGINDNMDGTTDRCQK